MTTKADAKLSDIYRDTLVAVTHYLENSYHNAGKRLTRTQACRALGIPESRLVNAITKANKTEPELVESLRNITGEIQTKKKKKKYKARKPVKAKRETYKPIAAVEKPIQSKAAKEPEIMVIMGNASAVMKAIHNIRGKD